MKPLISIVTASYNAVETIENTILSVINQDYPNLEYIIIDGGSTDGTVDIIKKYQNRIAYWVSELDNGLYYAMNKGITVATGDWVTMRNCGDLFAEKDSLSKLFKDPIDPTVDFLCAAAYRITDLGYYIAKSRDITQNNYKMTVVHPATFVRTSWHKQNLFNTKYRVCADYNLIYTSVQKGRKFEFRNIPIVIFPEGGYSSVHWDKGYREGCSVRGQGAFWGRIKTESYIIYMKFVSFIRHTVRIIPFVELKRKEVLIKKLDIRPLPLPLYKFY